MGVVNGQDVNQTVTNAAFIDANADDTGVGIYTLANADPVSGAQVDNIQRELNSLSSFLGKTLNAIKNALPSWASNDVGASNNDVKARADALSAKFNPTTGHKHTGAAGDAPRVASSDLAGVPLRGIFQQALSVVGATGSSADVSTAMAGKSESSGVLSTGVVTTAPYNKVILRQATGASTGDTYKDGSGNVVYGRLTKSGAVWTLSYFVLLSSTETAYSFGSASDIDWYYQEIFNPMVTAPVYATEAMVPSDNATADVIQATTTQQGKVSLATAAQPVASSSSAGTANAAVANADHAHEGVHALSGLLGDVLLAATSPLAMGTASQTHTFSIQQSGSTQAGYLSSADWITFNGKEPAIAAGTTAQYWRGDKSWQTLSTSAVPEGSNLYWTTGRFDASFSGKSTSNLAEGTNLYYTDARARAAISASGPLSYNSGTGALSLPTFVASGASHAAGAVPDPGSTAGTTRYLREDATWATVAAGGGGGGGALQWVEDVDAPIAAQENATRVYLFSQGVTQKLWATVKVPSSYVAGTQVFLKSLFYSPDSSGGLGPIVTAYLVRTGTDLMSATSNAQTVSGSITLSAGTVNKPQSASTALTDAAGLINGVAVSAGDQIKILVSRTDTSSPPSDMRFLAYSAEVKFS